MENEESREERLEVPVYADLLKKHEYEGRTIRAKMGRLSVSPFEEKNKRLLEIFIEGEEEPKALVVGNKYLGKLISMYGDLPSKWKDQMLTITFSDKKSFEFEKEGKKIVNDGIEIKFTR